jgi:hypothetical protein
VDGGSFKGREKEPHHGSRKKKMATTATTTATMTIKITMNDCGNPAEKTG